MFSTTEPVASYIVRSSSNYNRSFQFLKRTIASLPSSASEGLSSWVWDFVWCGGVGGMGRLAILFRLLFLHRHQILVGVVTDMACGRLYIRTTIPPVTFCFALLGRCHAPGRNDNRQVDLENLGEVVELLQFSISNITSSHTTSATLQKLSGNASNFSSTFLPIHQLTLYFPINKPNNLRKYELYKQPIGSRRPKAGMPPTFFTEETTKNVVVSLFCCDIPRNNNSPAIHSTTNAFSVISSSETIANRGFIY